ncbi:MAG: hypothetical protein OEZ03_09730 [Alphaproteobacteria bacterium]|nr:hypothetical protein [Alphaproteobacteria bacterium]
MMWFLEITGLSRLGAILVAGLAFLAAIGALLFGAHRSGRKAERADNLEAAAEAARKSGAIDEDVTGMSDADLYDELHGKGRG